MTPSYLRRETAIRDRWMISYMDVLTILLIFFVAIAAKVRLHPDPKPIAVVAPLAAPSAPPIAAAAASEPLQTLLQLRQKLEPYGLEMRMEPRGLVISLPQAILFSSGDDRISPHGLPIIAHIAEVLREVPNEVTLIGHADAVPIHNRHFLNNWDLATARSLRMLALLSQRYGVPESRFSIASYGTYRPAGPNDTPGGRAHNRRVEVVIAQ
jgi:chemotaxis protein MotB